MRAARLINAISRPAAQAQSSSDQVAVLNEVVAELAERIDVLETRERIARAALDMPRSRHRSRL